MYPMHCDGGVGNDWRDFEWTGRRLMRSDKVLIGLSDGEMGSQR